MGGNVWKVAAIGALVVLTTLDASEACAQLAPDALPTFGAARLQSGFSPDPHVLRGQVGGPIPAQQINGGCRGYVSSAPSHIVRSRTGFRQLRFVVSAASDSTLMVMLPDGRVFCDDDGGENMNPLVAVSSPPGRIAVWVGAYSQSSVGTPYTIGITELGHITASHLGGGPQPGPIVVQPGIQPPQVVGIQPQAPPAFGTLSLRSGFMPDPHVASGQAGGTVAGNGVNPNCRGHYAPQPSHVLMSPTGFNQIRFVVHSGIDTTLLVMLPNGQIFCDDDGGSGLNPLIATSSPAGPIRVWVGSYSSSQMGPYNIGFSELPQVGTESIPAPGGGGVVVTQPNVVQPTPADIVQMQVSIPVTLIGPGMTGNTVALWSPDGGQPTQISLQGGNLLAGGQRLETIPNSLRDPVITVVQQRRGELVVRAEQPPMGRGDRGQQFLLRVEWQGRPVVTERWSGTAVQRAPRWAR